jgi:hypothetical protein
MMLLTDAMLPLRCREFRRMCAQAMSSEDGPLVVDDLPTCTIHSSIISCG